MSHFKMLVVTDQEPSQDELAHILQPWHEYECTGINDEYVVEVDETVEALKGFATATKSVVRFPDGTEVDPYDVRFYRAPTQEEARAVGPFLGSGFAGGISYTSKDWGDGLGYSTRVRFVPENCEEVQVPANRSSIEHVRYDYGDEFPIVHPGEKAPEQGHMIVDKNDEVVKVVNFTNPDKKWDWWVVGGRYSGRLIYKGVIPTDSAMVEDIDFEAIARRNKDERRVGFQKAVSEVQRKMGWAKDRVLSELESASSSLRTMRSEFEAKETPGAFGQFIDGHHLGHAYRANPTTSFQHSCSYPIEGDASPESWMDSAPSIYFFGWVRDGSWKERGRMGWFGCVSRDTAEADWESEKQEFLSSLEPSQWITVVDCHI